MQPDLDQFLSYLEGSDLSDTDKRAFIQQVWIIMKNFADRAFGVDSSQQAINARRHQINNTSQSSTNRLGFNDYRLIDDG